MNDGFEVIKGKGSASMKDRIDEAKEKANADLEAKIEISRQPGVDAREVFTAEDFDEICRRYDYFKGTTANFSCMQRYNKLAKAARWLAANSLNVISAKIEPTSSSRPNAIICVDFERISAMRGVEKKAFTAMSALADSVFISGAKDAYVRVTFGVEGIWEQDDD